MRFEISDHVDSEAWNRTVCTLGGTIYHSTVWAEYGITSSPNTKAKFISLLASNGEVLGVALAFFTRSGKPFFSYLSGHLWLDSAPVVLNNSQELLDEFLRLLVLYAKRLRAIKLLVGSFSCAVGSSELEHLGFKLIKRLEFKLDLTKSEDDLWKGFSSRRRSKIRKAIQNGVMVEELSGDGLKEFRRLQAESARRINKRGGSDILHRGVVTLDPVLVLVKSGCAEIICARIEKEVLSGVIFSFFNGLVYYTQAGTSQKGLEAEAGSLLVWESIKRFRALGAKTFNFGGCKLEAMNEASPEHGVYRYKKDFGTTIIECTSGEKVLRPLTNGIVNKIKLILPR